MLNASFIAISSDVSKSRLLVSASLIRNFALIAILVFLDTGCASGGPAVIDIPTTPLQEGKTRIIVSRSTDLLYLGAASRLWVNGQQIRSLSRGDKTSVDVDPGRVTITTDAATSPGRFTIFLNVEPNKEYQFEVSPRTESYAPMVLFGFLGAAADASVNQNSGSFQIRAIGTKDNSVTPLPGVVKTSKKPVTEKNPHSSPTKQGDPSPKERLHELKKLLDDGLINQEDYDQKKRQILKDI